MQSRVEQFKVPYASHYNPRFVYFLPIFEGQKRFLWSFFCKILTLYMSRTWQVSVYMVSIQERVIVARVRYTQ